MGGAVWMSSDTVCCVPTRASAPATGPKSELDAVKRILEGHSIKYLHWNGEAYSSDAHLAVRHSVVVTAQSDCCIAAAVSLESQYLKLSPPGVTLRSWPYDGAAAAHRHDNIVQHLQYAPRCFERQVASSEPHSLSCIVREPLAKIVCSMHVRNTSLHRPHSAAQGLLNLKLGFHLRGLRHAVAGQAATAA